MSDSEENSSKKLAYDRIAQVYLGVAGSIDSQVKAQSRINWIASQVKGDRVLDIGCSEGILPILLGQKNISVVGIDINPLAISFAKELLQKEASEVQDKVSFFCADVFLFDITSPQFDTVILGEVIEHFEAPEKVIQKALEALKPGGCFIITTPFGYFPDVDHRQVFTLRTFLRLLYPCCVPESLAVADGYIRFVARKNQPSESDWEAFDMNYLLTLTEQAAISEQERYRRLLDKQIEETRSIHTERKRAEAESLRIQQKFDRAEQYIRQLEEESQRLLGENERSKEEVQQTKSEINKVRSDNHQVLTELKRTRESLTYYIDQFARYRDAFLDMESSVAYRLGNSLKLAVTKPGKNTALLPYTIGRLFVRGMKRIMNRKVEAPKPKENVQLASPFPSSNALVIKEEKEHQSRKRKEKQTLFVLDPSVRSLKDLKIACIMDAFTFISYAPECDLLQLTPDHWQAELESFQPHALFIESAWQGIDKLWYRQIDRTSKTLQEIVGFCNEKGIPTVFWNKEDPIHFDTFIQTATLFDFVFTTDIDAVRKYKAVCESNNVFLLPFAAQPRVHNPIEKYNRKDTFCFAGAYYVRYPERQRDLDTFTNVISEKWTMDIYDRNQFLDNPDYRFPQRYQKYIVGSLPPDQIDVAYKGYRYGVNMNSIKQSQTMFARRVFELLASNTVVVSNYSRGVRNFFGDLTICTDNENRLRSEVEKVASDEIHYRKYRLAGLRKVMQTETYHDRLAYVIAKVFGENKRMELPAVTVFSEIHTEQEVQRVLAAFDRQNYSPKRLVLVTNEQALHQISSLVPEQVDLISEGRAKESLVSDLVQAGFVTVFSPCDYYGPNYLMDMALSTRYIDVECVGKQSIYTFENEEITLCGDGQQYRVCDQMPKRSACVKVAALTGETAASLLLDVNTGSFVYPGSCFAVDEFNYCCNSEVDHLALVDDLTIHDKGIDSASVSSYAETLTRSDTDLFEIKGENLGVLFTRSKTVDHELFFYDQSVDIASTLEDSKHQYLYSNLWLSPYDYHIDKDVVCSISKTGDLDVQLVLIWYNSEKKQLGSTVVRPGVRTEIRIPESTALMRFAFRIQGSGHGSIRAIRFSTASQEGHNSWIAKSNQLLVTGQYPSYTDLYRNAFVHRRIAGYKSKGLAVDLLRINPYLKEGFEEFQGIDVVMGSCYTLESALASDSYDSILVHFMTENIWNVLKNYIGRVKVYIWIHGAEIQPWWRREFNTSSQDERDKAVADSLLRQALWNEIFASDQANLHYVFVSKYFANEVAQDYSLDLEKLNYSVIHNFIDTDLFNNPPKTVEKRKRILSIRPFASRKYANDLTAKTILALSNKPFFKELEFRIIGDGQLFEETMAPLRIFENVILEKRFITQENIVSIQREFGLFLTPTRMDSQGVSRDEAMSSGLVPLTNNVAAIPEFVDETCAILAPEEDYIALANGIEYLYEHPEVFLKMSKAAAARVRKQTSFEYTIAKEIALILREPIKN